MITSLLCIWNIMEEKEPDHHHLSFSAPCKKKSRTSSSTWLQQVDSQAQAQFHSVECDSSLRNSIERKIHQVRNVSNPDMDLDHILTQVPYRDILENLFSKGPGEEQEDLEPPLSLPIITKAYEESFMRQPHHNENPCVLGMSCECQFIDPCAPFTAVEFRLFHDPPQPQMCVLCSRKTTQKLFYDMCYSGKSPKCVIQRYGNIFGQPGEYSVECMLACPPNFNLHCMPLPIMSHQRNKYTVHSSGGVKSLQQHRVSYEHFQTPSVIIQVYP